MDVGGGVLCRVRVPDTNVMYVEVGSGFHVETHGREEVRRLLALQRQAAARRVQQAREVTSELQGQVDYVEASLEQLLKSMKHDYDDS